MLLRISTYHHGYPTWAEYHQRFLQRYGDGAVAPLLEPVADSDQGYRPDTPPRTRSRSPSSLATKFYWGTFRKPSSQAAMRSP